MSLFQHLINSNFLSGNNKNFYLNSKDIIQRWAFPLVPDLNRSDKTPRHTLSRHNVYKQPGVTLAKYTRPFHSFHFPITKCPLCKIGKVF